MLSDENADEDPESKIIMKDERPIGKRLKKAMVLKGKPLILEKVMAWMQSMAIKDELETKKVTPQKNNNAASNATTLATAKKEAMVEKKEAKKEVGDFYNISYLSLLN